MVFRAIGSATLQTAEKSGIAKNLIQPPYPCALPLPVVDDINDPLGVESILDFTFDSILDMLDDNLPKLNASVTDVKLHKPWKSVGYKDKAPGGDLDLQSRPHVGAYNFARALMTFRAVPPEIILHFMHSYALDVRRKYSENISAYDLLCFNPAVPTELRFDGVGNDKFHLPELAEMGIRDWHIEYNQYTAPPPVATRDMVYLVEKRYVPKTQRYYIYGTSIDFQDARVPINKKCIRGHVMFGWELEVQPNGDTKARYVSCMNPNGWTPAFLVGFFKSAIGKELTQSREMLYEILRADAKLNPPPSRPITHASAHIKSPTLTLNTLPVTTSAQKAGFRPACITVSQLMSPHQDPHDSEERAARGPRAGAPARIATDVARRLGNYHMTSETDPMASASPCSATVSLHDDSFSFASRASSYMPLSEDDEEAERHCEDARLCDAYEDEELCL